MKRTIAEKRAALLKEWVLARYGNNEAYYECTLYTGVPDGDTMEMVVDDLQDGWYDEEIDEMLAMYERASKRYGADGYYFNGIVIMDSEEFLRAAGYKLPDRIKKSGNYSELKKMEA